MEELTSEELHHNHHHHHHRPCHHHHHLDHQGGVLYRRTTPGQRNISPRWSSPTGQTSSRQGAFTKSNGDVSVTKGWLRYNLFHPTNLYITKLYHLRVCQCNHCCCPFHSTSSSLKSELTILMKSATFFRNPNFPRDPTKVKISQLVIKSLL